MREIDTLFLLEEIGRTENQVGRKELIGGEQFLDQRLNFICGAFGGNLLLHRFVAGGEFHDAVFHIARADDGSHRNAEQIAVGEHHAGAHVAVVINDLSGCWFPPFPARLG